MTITIQATLSLDARDGWTLRTPRGAVLFGPTWSMTEVNAWARDNHVEIVREETPA